MKISDQFQNRVLSNLKEILAFIENSPWNELYGFRIRGLMQTLDDPCILAVAGRVKAGKSSFINALLGRDVAKTGTTETTATINIIRYGQPPDIERPICCYWLNGDRTWETQEFLDSLQGYEQVTLDKASRIRQIEFLIDEPFLLNVTLVDTPGLDAITGDDMDSHQVRTETFFKLRERHTAETKQLTDSADAIVFLTGQVGTSSARDFLEEFRHISGGASNAMNAIGVMSKIDMHDEILENKNELAASIAEKLRGYLNTVVPVSAGIWRALDILQKDNRIYFFKNQLSKIPESEFTDMLLAEDIFLSTFFIDCPLTIKERKDLIGDMPWRVFVILAKSFYSNSVDAAMTSLADMAGVEKLTEILNDHFFKRSRILKYQKIVTEIKKFLYEIKMGAMYQWETSVGATKKKINLYLDLLNRVSGNDYDIAIDLKKYLLQISEEKYSVKGVKDRFNMAILLMEELELLISDVNNDFTALQLLHKSIDSFTIDEQNELFSLFSSQDYNRQRAPLSAMYERQKFWKRETNNTLLTTKKQIAYLASQKYESMNNNYT